MTKQFKGKNHCWHCYSSSPGLGRHTHTESDITDLVHTVDTNTWRKIHQPPHLIIIGGATAYSGAYALPVIALSTAVGCTVRFGFDTPEDMTVCWFNLKYYCYNHATDDYDVTLYATTIHDGENIGTEQYNCINGSAVALNNAGINVIDTYSVQISTDWTAGDTVGVYITSGSNSSKLAIISVWLSEDDES